MLYEVITVRGEARRAARDGTTYLPSTEDRLKGPVKAPFRDLKTPTQNTRVVSEGREMSESHRVQA